jgi:ankyrin repeat protein
MERVKQLLETGFPINVKDNFGWTPLHESINDDPASFAIMKVKKLIVLTTNANTFNFVLNSSIFFEQLFLFF